MHERPRTQALQELLFEQCKLRGRCRCFEQLRTQCMRSLAPEVGKCNVTIGQLLRIHAEQRRTAARMKMHADDMHVPPCIEHEVFRLRAMHDGALEDHSDVVCSVLEHSQIVGGEIE